MTLIEEISEEIKRFDERKKELANKLNAEIGNIVKEALKDSKKIDGIRWVQYIPSFNDGDPCEFTIGEIIAYQKDENGEMPEEFDMYSLSWYNWRAKYGDQYAKEIAAETPEFDKAEFDIYIKLESLMESIPYDIMEEMFGSNAEITITKEGEVKQSEYYNGY